MAKTLRQLLEAKYVSSADFVLSASGRKIHKRKKIADDDYDKENDVDSDEGENDKDDVKEGAVPAHMQGKQKPYVSSDGKGNYEVLGNRGQTKAEFSRKEHGKDAQSKAQAHLKSKYDEYMKEETEIEEGVNKSDIPAYLRKKTGDQLTTKDLDKERTQNRSHPETIKKINGTEMKEAIETTHEFHLRQSAMYKKKGDERNAKYHHDRAHEWHIKAAHDDTKRAEAELERKYRTEDTELEEQAPVAPSIGVHRIGVTVSDPDHPAVTKRKELIQKFVRVTAHDKDRAMEIGKKHFAKKGWKVHDANHSGMVHEEAINEYSMEDLHRDAAAHLKKSIDKQSDDRIAALKHPPKKKGFFARVGEKQINMVKGAYHGLTKEEVELEESKDKTDKRFDLLARLGLVEKDELANLRLAMKTLSEDKQLSIKQRDLLLNVYESLISLVTGDDTLFSRMKIKVQEESLSEMKDDPCWKDYQMVGTKKKNGKNVPNCVPKEGVENVPFDGPYTKTPDSVKDKSGAEHKPQSRARHLARLAMKQMAKKSDKA